jgi:hypothetical protein
LIKASGSLVNAKVLADPTYMMCDATLPGFFLINTASQCQHGKKRRTAIGVDPLSCNHFGRGVELPDSAFCVLFDVRRQAESIDNFNRM